MINSLTSDGTITSIKATNGLNGTTKCSWYLSSAKKEYAPTFKIDSLPWGEFYLQWIEWATTTGLGSNGVINGDQSAYKLGVYGSTGPYLNPLTAGTTDTSSGYKWLGSAISFAISEKSISAYRTGSVGDAVYYGDKDMTPFSNQKY
jgi:hypothetical protein